MSYKKIFKFPDNSDISFLNQFYLLLYHKSGTMEDSLARCLLMVIDNSTTRVKVTAYMWYISLSVDPNHEP